MLKNIGGSAAAISIGSATVSASEDEILNSDAVTSVLNAAGNPDTLFVEPEPIQLDGVESKGEPMEGAKIGTEVGTIIYVNEGTIGEGTETAHLTFDRGSQKDIPRRFRTAPNGVDAGLSYEGGQVRDRREATPAESNRLERILSGEGIETDESVAFYDASLHGFFVGCEDGSYRIELSDSDAEPSVSNTFVSALRRSKVDVSSVYGDETDDVSAQDHCYSLGGPCAACALSSGGCVLCGSTCLTGALPACGACIALSCGAGGIACGCCLGCLDGHEVTHDCTDYI